MPEDPLPPFSISRILVPLDTAESSRGVMPYVEGLAERTNARIVLFRAVERDSDTEAADKELEQMAAPLRTRGMGVATAVARLAEHASPAAAIVSEAARQEASIIAMTPHSQAGRGDLLGSTAHLVLQDGDVPVLVLQADADRWAKPPAIVVGLDGSDRATLAIAPAVGLARIFDAELVLVQALPPPAPLGGAARYYGAVDDPAEHYLETVAAQLPDTQLRITVQTGTQQPERELAAAADARPTSIIVLSTRGLSGRPNTLGSVTDRVVRMHGHPVLAVPARF